MDDTAPPLALPVMPPLKPMLAKSVDGIPTNEPMLYEPKWDGFRCIIFRDGDNVILGSRNEKSLTRYFPELIDPIRASFPDRCVIDGEVVVACGGTLDFDALGQRIHPADSRVQRLAVETPASFVAFDLIALGDDDLRGVAFGDRHRQLAELLGHAEPPVHLTPSTFDPAVAEDWFHRFEGAGFDGVMAKPLRGNYLSDKRVQWKVKHKRTAEVVIAGARPHKDGNGVGSLLLGLYDSKETLHHIGVASSFTAVRRTELVAETEPYLLDDPTEHPWASWMNVSAHTAGQRMPGAPSRWNAAKDQSWIPMNCQLVAEVGFEQVTSGRLRHPARLVRWRPDKSPAECRYDQLEQIAPVELAEVFRS